MTILELAHQIGLNPKWVASTGGGEYHSACPTCGGTKRFYMHPSKQMSKCMGAYRCRECGIHGDAIEFARRFLNLSFQEAAQTVNAIIIEKTISPTFKKSYSSQITKLKPPPEKWISDASDFVEQAHQRLLHRKDILNFLASRGIPINVVIRHKLGWSEKDEYFSRPDWGLDKQLNDNGKARLLWIPKGIVIPSIEPSGKVVRLKIRRCDWKKGDELPKYVAISGSMNGLNLIGNTTHNSMLVVESELDGYATENAVSDFAFVIAVGSNTKNPDNLTDNLAKNKTHLCILHDNDDAGRVMLRKWQQLYPHAKGYTTPIGKDIGEAIEQGLNIRSWILTKIIQEQKWHPDDQELLQWFLQYASTKRGAYMKFEREILLGPNSHRAKTGELQHGFRLIKQAIEEHTNLQEST